MLGSSAARHACRLGASVALVGPGEPEVRSEHTGPFGSHYDSGRISRILDRDPYYATIAAASIARFDDLEAETGVRFHHPVGHLAIGSADDYVSGLLASASAHDLSIERFPSSEVTSRFPMLAVRSGMHAIVESDTGGFIDPRRFIDAQSAATKAAGGVIVDDAVTAIESGSGHHDVRTDRGVVRAHTVLLATGSFANHFGVVPQPVEMDVQMHTVVLAQVDDAARQQLAGMPTIIYKRGDQVGESSYTMPPILYPDGNWYVKIGQSVGHAMQDPAQELVPWFQGHGDDEIAGWLRDELRSLVPDVSFGPMVTDSCVVNKTPTGRQYIDEFPVAGVYSLLGGNGQVAKSADELGRIAAHRVVGGTVPNEYRDTDFRLRFAAAFPSFRSI